MTFNEIEAAAMKTTVAQDRSNIINGELKLSIEGITINLHQKSKVAMICVYDSIEKVQGISVRGIVSMEVPIDKLKSFKQLREIVAECNETWK